MKSIKILLLIVSIILVEITFSKKIKNAKGDNVLNQKCSKDTDCISNGEKMICSVKNIKPKCDKETCVFEKEQSSCRLKANQPCISDDNCASNTCDPKSKKCTDYKRKFLENCVYSYIWNECEENTYCTQTGVNKYKCLGGPNHRCENKDECYNNSCGVGILPSICNGLGVKILKDTASWLYNNVK